MATDEYDAPADGLQPSGAQRFLTRALYVFFGHPIRFLIPALLVTAFGVYSALTAEDEYRSSGSLTISADTFLSELSEVRSSDFGFDTPATAVTRRFNELMQTDGFATTVVSGAGLDNEFEAGLFDLDDVRAAVFAEATGDSLMRVNAVWSDPARAEAFAISAIASYRNSVLTSEVDQQSSAETVYDEQVETYKNEVDTAFDAYSDYLEAHPAPADARDDREISEVTEIQRLSDQLSRAQERLDGALDSREAARLASVESAADIDQRLKVIDEPQLPTSPESGLKVMAVTIVLFGLLGLMASLGALAIVTLLDRSIQSTADLERLGAPVRAVVPHTRHVRATAQVTNVSTSRKRPVRPAT